MITPDATQAYNARLTVALGDLAGLSPERQDQVKAHGSRAEALLRNPDLAQFIHQYKFEVCDALAAINTHDSDANLKRVALTNHLAGIDQFVASLQRAVYMKNRVVSQQASPVSAPTPAHKEVYKP